MYSLNERSLIILDHVSWWGWTWVNTTRPSVTEQMLGIVAHSVWGLVNARVPKVGSGFSLATTTDSYRSSSTTHFHYFLRPVSVSCHFFILHLKIFSRNVITLVHSFMNTLYLSPGRETLKPHSLLHFFSISGSSTFQNIQEERAEDQVKCSQGKAERHSASTVPRLTSTLRCGHITSSGRLLTPKQTMPRAKPAAKE